MSITEDYAEFRYRLPNELLIDDILELNIPESLKGKKGRNHDDIMHQIINVGDIVSYSRRGNKVKGIGVGLLVGFTESGFRVANIRVSKSSICRLGQKLETPPNVVLMHKRK